MKLENEDDFIPREMRQKATFHHFLIIYSSNYVKTDEGSHSLPIKINNLS